MLTRLQLRDLVIVDEAEIEFGPGLTALTGETGAGKSIVVDALLLIAGGRGAGDVVRHGAERAEVSAAFAHLPPAASRWLEEQSVEHDGEVLVRRVIGADGRSRAYLNGQPVPIQTLREFGELLIEVHGQQEFQHLVKRSAQRELLDEHLPDRSLIGTLASIHERYRACRGDYESLKSAAGSREARLDLLRYQLSELKAEATTVAGIEELFVEQKRIAGRGRLAEAARTALGAVYEEDGLNARDLLAKASAALRSLDADPELAQAAKLIAEAGIVAREAAETLRRYLDALEIDPARQEEVERRAATLESLARKHRRSVLELPAHLVAIEQEIQTLANAERSFADYEVKLEELGREYDAVAERLTGARELAAAALGAEISELMQELGMKGGRFAVSVEPAEDSFGPHGRDQIEFLVSANPGLPPKSLAKVASGGELSRISLAVQVAAAAGTSALCMVFDEVDAGIGGGVAEIVGRLLRSLGERAQVLCVTHLAQVAAQAHNHLRVTKWSDGRMARTAVHALSASERVDEIARMLGGVEITEQARAHALEMLNRSSPAPARGRRRAPTARS